MVTRSQSGIIKPIDRLSLHTTSISPLPKSSFLALQNPHWNNAMHDEYNVLVKNGTWILVPRPAGITLVRSMWLFKHKFHADGTLSRYKARLVANGSSQQLGIDCDETFSPVVKPATIHTVLSLAVSRKLCGPPVPSPCLPSAEVFIWSKQAPRAWFQRFAGYATRVGFYHSHCDSPLFILGQGSQVAYLLIYVDDIILTASSTYLLQQVITSLHNEFDMTNLGAPNYFLGISATRHSTGLFLSQKQYTIKLLARAHMTNCNPLRTPVDTDSKLGPEGVPVQDPTLYRSLAADCTEVKTNKVKAIRKSSVKYAEMYKRTTKKPNVRGNQRNWNNLKSHQLDLRIKLMRVSNPDLLFTDPSDLHCSRHVNTARPKAVINRRDWVNDVKASAWKLKDKIGRLSEDKKKQRNKKLEDSEAEHQV
nr:ribonuclease H-like domain-containing protein [Tanacetum cinerariifolium]